MLFFRRHDTLDVLVDAGIEKGSCFCKVHTSCQCDPYGIWASEVHATGEETTDDVFLIHEQIHGDTNPTDIGTQPLTKGRTKFLISMLSSKAVP